jgi:hypothetical protein
MTKPRLNHQYGNVLAHCPDCDAITNFEPNSDAQHPLGTVIVNSPHQFEDCRFSRYLWRFFRCANCNRGALAKIHDNGGQNSHLDRVSDFLPQAIEKARLPDKVPADIAAEFREAELDAAHSAYRSGSALLRSVLEKTLKKNGYEEVEIVVKGDKKKTTALIHRIEAAADDGVITQARKARAHENIRVLGNDILHDDWREVKREEFDDAHHYTQRILEDLYDDRATVEKILGGKGRPFTPGEEQQPSTTISAGPVSA